MDNVNEVDGPVGIEFWGMRNIKETILSGTYAEEEDRRRKWGCRR